MGLELETISVCLGVQCFRHGVYAKCNLLWASKHDLGLQEQAGDEAWLSRLPVNKSPRLIV